VKQVALGAGAGAAFMAAVMSVAVPQITQFEGTEYQAYRDVGGILTVCSGHTGPDVVVKQVYTADQCTALTREDAEKASAGVLKVSPQLLYHPIQLASAISFTYNVGINSYAKSSVASNFNTGNFSAACGAMLKYVYADGKLIKGLYNRRVIENQLCMSTLTVEGMKDIHL